MEMQEALLGKKTKRPPFDVRGLLDMLRKPKTTTDEIRAALKGLSVEVAETRVEELEASRRRALIDGTDSQVEEIERQILIANRDVERVVATIQELNVRLELAEASELQRKIDSTAASMRKIQAEQVKLYVELDALAMRLAEVLRLIKEGDLELDKNCKFLDAHGRDDLKPDHLLSRLAAHVGIPSAASLPQIRSWQLHGYIPMHPDGPMLGRMAELKL